MKYHFRIVNAVVLFALLIFSVGFITIQPASADVPRVCIPTCSEVDGRMLAVASVGYITLAGQSISVEIAVPGSLSTFSFGFFDGDSGGMWDNGTVPLVYTLYANPNLTHDTSMQVAQWTGASMADNAWTDLIVDQDDRAMAPSGDYFYFLQIELPNVQTVNTVSNFKLRSNSPIELATDASFAYVIPLNTMAEFNIIYPGYATNPSDPFAITTYDGTWDIYLNVPTSSPNFSIWDGDTDYGSYDCSLYDTNDPDTLDEVLPSWASGISAYPEGVAVTSASCKDASFRTITGPEGEVFTSGNPADDTNNRIYLRSPSVVYDVIDPNGNVYHNGNPSGNQEWEQFRIESDPAIPADYYVDGLLPAGIYHIRMTGLDMHNLNAWHLISGKVVCVNEDNTPCEPILHPYLIGDTIWYDANGNSILDDGEMGIQGVTITLLDLNGQPVPGGTAVTDVNGQYTFGVETGTYSVQVDEGNFIAGDPLANLNSTTGGELQTYTVTTDNVLVYDFGYKSMFTGNYCGFIRTPGFWKNYKNHMSDATFLSIIQSTRDFKYLTISQAVKILGTNNGKTKLGIPELDGTDARFLKFLLTAEINAVWNGEDKAADLDGALGYGYYQDTNMSVNQLLQKAYLNRYAFSTEEYNYAVYLGGGGENDAETACLVQSTP